MRPKRWMTASLLAALIYAQPAVAWASVSRALWHMDETAGTVMVDAAGSSNGTLHSVTVGSAGFAGTAYTFNGASSYVSVPSSSALVPGSRNVLLTVHLKTGSRPARGDYDLLRKGSYPKPFYKLELLQSGLAFCQFRGKTGGGAKTRGISGGPNLADQRWHTVSCSKTATAVQLVVDGVTYSSAVSLGSIDGTEPLVLGAHPGSDYYNGVLDEVSVTLG